MFAVNLAQARERPSELLDNSEVGQEVAITRRSKAVAHLSAFARLKKPFPLMELAEFRAAMPLVASPLGKAPARSSEQTALFRLVAKPKRILAGLRVDQPFRDPSGSRRRPASRDSAEPRGGSGSLLRKCDDPGEKNIEIARNHRDRAARSRRLTG